MSYNLDRLKELTDRLGKTSTPEELKLLQVVLEAVPDGVIIIDEQGTILLANIRIVELFGYPRQELAEHTIEILLPEEIREKHISHRASYFMSPRKRSMGEDLKITGRRKDGSIIPLDISISYIEAQIGLLGIAFIRPKKNE